MCRGGQREIKVSLALDWSMEAKRSGDKTLDGPCLRAGEIERSSSPPRDLGRFERGASSPGGRACSPTQITIACDSYDAPICSRSMLCSAVRKTLAATPSMAARRRC